MKFSIDYSKHLYWDCLEDFMEDFFKESLDQSGEELLKEAQEK